MNAVGKSDYRTRLKLAIEHLHGCQATWVATAPVHESFRGQTVWTGDVEVYDIVHPRAKRCYGWSHAQGKQDQDERFVAVLEIPPVDSPVAAVRASIVADSKRKKK